MNDKPVDAMADLGDHFNKDMNKLKEQNGGDQLYEDILNDLDEDINGPNDDLDEIDDEDPLRGVKIDSEPKEDYSYEDIYNEPSEEEIEAAEDGFPEIAEEDEPVFFGGPLKSEIDSWKKQFKGQTVFITQVANEYFIVRTLNRYEYKQIIAIPNTDPLMREEIFCHTCVLWPRPYDWKIMASGKSGVPSTLATIIMEQSGFVKNYELEVL